MGKASALDHVMRMASEPRFESGWASSGSVEEIELMMQRFTAQLEGLRRLKNECGPRGVYGTFADIGDLQRVLPIKLTLLAAKLLESVPQAPLARSRRQ